MGNREGSWAYQVAHKVKNLPTMWETRVQSLAHPDNGVSASDSVRVPPGLVLRQVDSTLASVAPRQRWGLSGSCPAETASEDPAHPFSLGFRK